MTRRKVKKVLLRICAEGRNEDYPDFVITPSMSSSDLCKRFNLHHRTIHIYTAPKDLRWLSPLWPGMNLFLLVRDRGELWLLDQEWLSKVSEEDWDLWVSHSVDGANSGKGG
jgi:hypothetical protein